KLPLCNRGQHSPKTTLQALRPHCVVLREQALASQDYRQICNIPPRKGPSACAAGLTFYVDEYCFLQALVREWRPWQISMVGLRGWWCCWSLLPRSPLVGAPTSATIVRQLFVDVAPVDFGHVIFTLRNSEPTASIA